MYTWHVSPHSFAGAKMDEITSGYSSSIEFCKDIIEDYKRVLVKPEKVTIEAINIGYVIYDMFTMNYPKIASKGLFCLIGKDGEEVKR